MKPNALPKQIYENGSIRFEVYYENNKYYIGTDVAGMFLTYKELHDLTELLIAYDDDLNDPSFG